ncbi:hypothetical protein [Paenibacillus antri]|uniref:hypothetical protein n=1 Tax=Paenibacillus antri TaxID=2582848 RepID=UPI0013052A45|nr:hypothetical protein [Paenibacillus antri]
MNDSQRTLTSLELVRLAQALKAEERLTWLFAQGAAECEQPQLRSYFAHQADRNGERLEELTKALQTYAGTAGPAPRNAGVFS